MKDSKQLRVWNESHRLTLILYRETRAFPREEVYGLPAKSAELQLLFPPISPRGADVARMVKFTRFLQTARGSASELEYHSLLSHDLGFLAHQRFEEMNNKLVKVQRMLTALVQRVQPVKGLVTRTREHKKVASSQKALSRNLSPSPASC